MFTIKNKELQELDSDLFTFNKEYSIFSRSLDRVPNPYAGKTIGKKLAIFKKRLAVIKKLNEFDSIVKENMENVLSVQQAYVDFFFGDAEMPIDTFTSKILGPRAISIIKTKLKELNYETIWKYWRSLEEYSYKGIPAEDEAKREMFRSILNDLKKDIMAYGEKNFNFPKNYEFDLALGLPHARNNSSFHPTAKRLEIALNDFKSYKDESGSFIDVSYVINSFFHELIGHARHEYNSRNLPLTIQDNSVNLPVLTSHIHAEGVSQRTQDAAIGFMEEYAKKYEIRPDFIAQMKLAKTGESRGIPYIYYLYLKSKCLENPKFNVSKEFLKVNPNRAMLLNYSISDDAPLSFLKRAIYVIGEHYMDELFADLKKEYGAKYCEENSALINEAVSTGLWHFNVLPKFTRYFLNNHQSKK